METGIDRKRLSQDLHNLLVMQPGQNKYQLHEALRPIGWRDISISDINSVLYSSHVRFRHNDDSLPLWYPRSTAIDSAPVLQAPRLEFYQGPPLREWQREALDAWRAAGHRGVVEAVTGTGKTAVGIAAAADAAARGLRTLIIVPGIDLLDQWYRMLTTQLSGLQIGRYGDTHNDTLYARHVVVMTVQSASRYRTYRTLPTGLRGLLIADEVHRYGAGKFAEALEDTFEDRLGLTATYEREDSGIERYLTPYFLPNGRNGTGEVVANCGYARGRADGILAPFRVGFVGVGFKDHEQQEYNSLDAQVRKARRALISEYGCPEDPFGEFMKAVTQLSEGSNGKPIATGLARRYLAAFSKRRALLADCERKIAALGQLAPMLKSAERALVFTETVQSAERAAERLNGLGIAAASYTSDLDHELQKERLARFRAGLIHVLAAPRKLDEGVDVPEADVGVIVASSRSRRQMIQRMGRIIRPKHDKRSATFIVLYVANTRKIRSAVPTKHS